MRIVVTGALGHIGSSLIRLIPSTFESADIVLVDDLSSERYSSLFGLPPRKYCFVQGDILNLDLDSLFSGADDSIHLAAITNAEASFAVRDRVFEVNVAGTRRVAQAAARAGAGLVFVSTTSVYGSQAA